MAERVSDESNTMTDATEQPLDLGAAIIAEIDRTLDTQFTSSTSAVLLELVDALAMARRALQHREDTLARIKATLLAAAAPRDGDVTAT